MLYCQDLDVFDGGSQFSLGTMSACVCGEVHSGSDRAERETQGGALGGTPLQSAEKILSQQTLMEPAALKELSISDKKPSGEERRARCRSCVLTALSAFLV